MKSNSRFIPRGNKWGQWGMPLLLLFLYAFCALRDGNLNGIRNHHIFHSEPISRVFFLFQDLDWWNMIKHLHPDDCEYPSGSMISLFGDMIQFDYCTIVQLGWNHSQDYHHFRSSIHLSNVYYSPKFNIAPEKWWLEDYFPIGKVSGTLLSFGRVNIRIIYYNYTLHPRLSPFPVIVTTKHHHRHQFFLLYRWYFWPSTILTSTGKGGTTKKYILDYTRWWFQICFYFHPIWRNCPNLA